MHQNHLQVGLPQILLGVHRTSPPPDLTAAGHINGHITVIMLPKNLQEQQWKQIPMQSSSNEHRNT